ncbi:hypothetical protein CC1G_00356 [Coprinopsis cinerea okayama7|uniref:Uncharacterized protein n=1 Tax=Coprinopsis cinerea (strain Okayama-7 / 130 / ATCC MYA-4618 / FGSC 9003) TaxID=240176 RepID=A8NXN5_COPC7|nr:hypothetical protein CC1G_00356 [Coprinopsis cinerea okayama7\|eukprot:XP_001837220.1 hypothetical protein CC1G_00356 [Coprinopsis cinerea okayama7\
MPRTRAREAFVPPLSTDSGWPRRKGLAGEDAALTQDAVEPSGWSGSVDPVSSLGGKASSEWGGWESREHDVGENQQREGSPMDVDDFAVVSNDVLDLENLHPTCHQESEAPRDKNTHSWRPDVDDPLDLEEQPSHVKFRLEVFRTLADAVADELTQQPKRPTALPESQDMGATRPPATQKESTVDKLCQFPELSVRKLGAFYCQDDIRSMEQHCEDLGHWVQTIRSNTLIPLQGLIQRIRAYDADQDREWERFLRKRASGGEDPGPFKLKWLPLFREEDSRIGYFNRRISRLNVEEKIANLEERLRKCNDAIDSVSSSKASRKKLDLAPLAIPEPGTLENGLRREVRNAIMDDIEHEITRQMVIACRLGQMLVDQDAVESPPQTKTLSIQKDVIGALALQVRGSLFTEAIQEAKSALDIAHQEMLTELADHVANTLDSIQNSVLQAFNQRQASD